MDDLLARLGLRGMSKKVLLSVGIAAAIAIMAVIFIWSQGPKYKVVFSNFNDKDGGAIVAVLEQQNIPYKLGDGGGSIMVPADMVYQTRLKLAAMGLPKSGNVGFELLENQKFGVSQFVEQVNFQRALEGELERSIQSISGVEVARVHLAIPKTTVFIRDEQKPTASVLVKLAAGRSLDQRQVSAVVHLVASSVPNLGITNVDVVDQSGNLLSDSSKGASKTLDANQVKYVEDLQKNIAARVQSIIAPMVGVKNVRAEANAEIDFTNTEEANEIFKPNQRPEGAVIRSLQSNESVVPAGSTTAGSGTGGVPGALSNQPPANAAAALNTAPPGGASTGAAGNAGTPSAAPASTQRNTTTNFEVDKTVSFVQKSMGGVKRLSVAVVVNNKADIDAEGKEIMRPLNDDEKQQITELAKQAMGFNEARGDSLSVVNTPFSVTKAEVVPDMPIWKDPANIEMAKNIGQVLLGLVALFIIYRKVVKPMLASLLAPDPVMEAPEGTDDTGRPILKLTPYQKDLRNVQALAKENPKVVADVVADWVGNS